MKYLLSFVFVIILFTNASSQVNVEKLNAYIQKSLKQWEVPGFAMAIVKDGKVVLSKGYGVRELGKPDIVNEQTIFDICSTTKAMTAAAMGLLVDEGKVKWDDRVVQHLPEFQLYDPYVTRELRIRDLFTHNAGLGNADFLWAGNENLTQDEILYKMRLVEPAYSLRGGYTYQNIMYLAAGKVIERLSGMPWERFMQERLFKPLGMSNTYPNGETSLVEKNRSIPHHRADGKIIPIQDLSADPIAPAGAIWSSIEDMAKWTQFMLDSARVNGKRLLKPETYAELLRPQVIIPQNQFYPTVQLTKPHWTTYALGWFQHDYNGRAVSFHTGSLPGTIAIIGLIPDEKLGVFVLGNLDHAEVRHALMYKVFDVFAGLENGRDWSTEIQNLYKKLDEPSEKRRKEWEAKRVQNTKPTLALAAYAGKYTHPLYGTLEVSWQNNQLQIKSERMSANLKHWHYNTFYGKWNNEAWRDNNYHTFHVDVAGNPAVLETGGIQYKRVEK